MNHTQDNTALSAKERFENLFNVYKAGLNGQSNAPIAQFRSTAFAAFLNDEFPTRKTEDWKYTSVTPIINTILQPVSTDAGHPHDNTLLPNSVNIDFVNGKLVTDLTKISFEGLTIQKLEQALQSPSVQSWVSLQLEEQGGTEHNSFLPLNHAFAADGIYIQVSKNSSVETALHFRYMSGGEAVSSFVNPQLFIQMEQSSNATIVESYTSLNSDDEATYFTNTANRIEMGKNANLVHLKLQEESLSAHQINNSIVRQMRDSEYSHYALDLGGSIVRNNMCVRLLDENTQTHLYGSFIGAGDQHIDNQTFIDHAMPNCQSNEMYKGILIDKARGVFNGKVLVRQDAQKTNAFQQSSSLVLSPTAVMDTKPQLEIFADDVKCSHGATIGQLDESSIFYLNSRGLSNSEAKRLLKRAFISEVVDHIKNEDLRDYAYERINIKLNDIQL